MIIINPGTGKVDNSIEKNAITNMEHFKTDLKNIGISNIEIIRYETNDYDKQYKDGRFCFILKKDNFCYEIQMPGLPLEKVRWMNAEQDIWNFPRLYVDGSSWIWGFALNICDFGKEDE